MTTPPSSNPSDLNGPTIAGLRAALGWSQFTWCLLVLCLWSLAVARLPLDPDYTAGELLDHVMSWQETGVLYPALHSGAPLRVLNYPPLVLSLVRAVAALGIAPLLAGRLVNSVGLIALGCVVCAWSYARNVRGAALAGTVGLLAAAYGIVYGAGQLHIELWAVALTVAGFWLLQLRETHRVAVLGGLALALACFAKQSQVVPALVAIAWTWRFRRGTARWTTVVFVLAGIAGSLAITLVWGLEPWRHMLTYTVGTYSLQNLGVQLLSHVLPWALLFAVAAALLWRERARAARDPLVWYWIVAALWSLSAARVGSGYPYFLDLQVATVLLIGPPLFSAHRSRLWSYIIAAQIVAADVGAVSAAAYSLLATRRVSEILSVACDQFPASGPVLTEAAGLARACHRASAIHPFIMTSLAARGLWNAEPFEAAVRSGTYGSAILPFDPRALTRVTRERWTPGLLIAFREASFTQPIGDNLWVARWRR